jgi:AcrR family transcriptional regulator
MAVRLEGPALLGHPLAGAVIEVVAERGYGEATIEEIVARAGVTREDFDLLFADKADAVRSVVEALNEDFRDRVASAYAREPAWPDSLRAAAYELVAWVEDHPLAFAFGMKGIRDADEMTRLRQEELFRWCAGLIDAGREAAPDPAAIPEAAPSMAIGSIVEIVTRHATGVLDADPVATVPELMYPVVRPYLGEEAARAELSMPRPGRRA